MDLSMFKTSGWNLLQHSNRKLLEESIEENEVQLLLIRIPSRDSFLRIQCLERHVASVDPNVKELMPLREGLHVTTQCYMRQHDECLYSTSWRESTRTKFMHISSECSKIRSESSEYMWKTMGVLKNSWRVKKTWRATLKNMHRKFGRETG